MFQNKRWVLSAAFVLCVQLVFGQMRGWELGGWLGGANYFGDLNTNWRLDRIQLAGGGAARFNFNDRLALRMGLNGGRVQAFDSDSKNTVEQRRNLHFRSLVVDATLQFEFNFLPYVHGHREYFYTPYMFIGPSFYYYNPQAELDGKWYNLREYGTEGQFRGEEYNNISGAVAYGMGFKYDLSYRWSLDFQLSARRLFSDYIDDVSSVYPDARDVRAIRGEVGANLSDRSIEPKVGQPGRQRGNGKRNDAYVMFGVGVHYYFGSIRCPGITKR
jgi:Domain of unknown function (DUF6089)